MGRYDRGRLEQRLWLEEVEMRFMFGNGSTVIGPGSSRAVHVVRERRGASSPENPSEAVRTVLQNALQAAPSRLPPRRRRHAVGRAARRARRIRECCSVVCGVQRDDHVVRVSLCLRLASPPPLRLLLRMLSRFVPS